MAIYVNNNSVSTARVNMGQKFRDFEHLLLSVSVKELLNKSWSWKVQDEVDPTFRDMLEEAEWGDRSQAVQDALDYQLAMVNARIEDSLRATRGGFGLPKAWPALAANLRVEDGFLCWSSPSGDIQGEVDLTSAQETRLAAVC